MSNRYWYLHVLQGDYGQGWEDICQSESRQEMRDDRDKYRENAPEYNYRIIQRRELKPQCPTCLFPGPGGHYDPCTDKTYWERKAKQNG